MHTGCHQIKKCSSPAPGLKGPVTNHGEGGGATKQEVGGGEQVKFYPYEKGGM